MNHKALFFILMLFYSSIANSAEIKGIVKQPEDGTAVSGVEVAYNAKISTTTDSEGIFSLNVSGLKEGDVVWLYLNKENMNVCNAEKLFFRYQKNKEMVFYMISDQEQKSRNIYFKTLCNNIIQKNSTAKNVSASENAQGMLFYFSKVFSEIIPESENVTFNKAFSFFKEGKDVEALNLLDDTSAENLLMKARISILQLNFTAAESYYQDLISKDNHLANLEYALFLEFQYKYSNAVSVLNEMLAKNPNDYCKVLIYNRLGNLYSEQMIEIDSESAFNNAIKILKIYTKIDVTAANIELGKTYINFAIMKKKQLSYKPSLECHSDSRCYVDTAEILLEMVADNSSVKKLQQSCIYMHDFLNDYPIENIEIHQLAIQNREFAEEVIENQGNNDVARTYYEISIENYEKLIKKDPDFNHILSVCLVYESLNAIENNNKKRLFNQSIVLEHKLPVYEEFKDGINEIRKSMSNSYSLMAWYQFVDKEYKAGKLYAMKAYVTDPTQDWINVLLALSYLLNDEPAKAFSIYKSYADKPYRDQTYREVFLQSLTDIEAEGVTHADFKKVRKLLSE